MVSMVSGSRDFAPRVSDGLTALFEPMRSLASAIVDYHEGTGAPALKSTLYALALLMLFSGFILSIAAYLIKLRVHRYQVRS
jgi:ABC-type phosphate transport system permease subunit